MPVDTSAIPVQKTGGNGTVGIVDDDTSLLRALGRLVRAAGFTVKTFTSAEEFLDFDQRVPFRCLVLDVRLGGMDGFELHERLRARGGAPPVIFITAHDEVDNRERARRAGALELLRKPLDDAALVDAIHRLDPPRIGAA